MKKHEFEVWFLDSSEPVRVLAFTFDQARILAQAQRIEEGKPFKNVGRLIKVES